MGLMSSSSKVTEEIPSSYDFQKAVGKSISSQQGNYIIYLFDNKGHINNNDGRFSIVLYNPMFSAKCFRLLELHDTNEAKEKFRYMNIILFISCNAAFLKNLSLSLLIIESMSASKLPTTWSFW